ncbi:MAG: UDP-N-acetylglucosamine diphosphorylase/glucosamine-1-phosphate N-acetyltransferase [Pelagibacteraceae bacterium TMED237]|nr:MAG: UDP-N-acetylglucosamine diphosphorylase/glucosamine-1-phosphate N-acetyltransferase [Pelagibacteraceae bacterium TMED237]|tara:strand:+ start:2943 stop:4241 length:1299 start_codon:yes stop_codon:yes gene_type:complete
MSNITTVILAAGKSTRFKSKTSKLTYPLCGLPIISHVYETAKKISGKKIIVVCNKDNLNELKLLLKDCTFVVQKYQKGTADAIEQARNKINSKNVLVLFGDTPLINVASLKKLIKKFISSKVIASLIAFRSLKPFGYGRLITNNNFLKDIVEEINLENNYKKINLCNSGILIANKRILFDYLKKVKINTIKKERYLPEIFKIFYINKLKTNFIECNEDEMLGINTFEDYNRVNDILQKKYINKFISKGVNFLKPSTCYLSFDTKIESNVVIESNVTIKEKTIIKKGTIIKSNSYLEGVTISENCNIGPSARIRPSSIIGQNSKVGNFVEIKNSKIGKRVSIAHLSYVGDAIVGNNVNIGAGTITCNYDGKKKHKTIIKDNVFIGSNSSLIAPLILEEYSRIGAGSVITKNIPKRSLALERTNLKIVGNKRAK